MYASPAKALADLLDGKVEESKCRITGTSLRVKSLKNGIKYFAVEVTSESGSQYGISAYDGEAEELYRLAMGRHLEAPLVISQ